MAGKLETEDQESCVHQGGRREVTRRQMARWRRKPEPLPPPGVDDELSQPLATIPGSTPATPNTSRGEIELRPAVPDDQSPLERLVERRSLEDFPGNP